MKKYLRNQGIQFDEKKIVGGENENSIVDVYYQDTKFQVVFADFGLQKAISTALKDESGAKIINRPTRSPEDVWKDFVREPILKKSKYGKSANGVTLLINCYTEPPWVEKDINIAKKTNPDFLKSTGFDEIYLVFPEKNVKIYKPGE